MINWTDGGCKISKHFTVRHAIWLQKWSRLALEDELDSCAKTALVNLFTKMDKVVDQLGRVYVHSAFRPRGYNAIVGGAKQSAHMAREVVISKVPTLLAAVDFHVDMPNKLPGSDSCDAARKALLPNLKYFGLRMENNPGSDWVHMDTRPPTNGQHYFLP